MSVSSDSAEQIVKMSLDGAEVALRIAGNGTKDLAGLVYTLLRDNLPEHEHGRAWLKQAVKDGKNVTFFELRQEDLKEFVTQAKKYAVHYCAVRNGKSEPIVELLVDANDALKVQHIMEKFKLSAIKDGTVELPDAPATKKKRRSLRRLI